MALLVPSKLFRTLAGGGVRRLLIQRALHSIEDFSDGTSLFDAATYPAVVVARRGAPDAVRVTVHRPGAASSWISDARSLPFDETAGSPWLLAPPDVREVFDAIRASGRPLATTSLGRPTLGVKTGCNEAFLCTHPFSETLERFTRPVLRGESLRPWMLDQDGTRILWTHGAGDEPLDVLPAGLRDALAAWKGRLQARRDLRCSERWWTLFRTAAASSRRPRIVWADMSRSPRAAYLPAGDPTVPLNSCYVVACEDDRDALALCALLNSPLAGAWLRLLAEPARGGYRRYLGWTVALLPIPLDWESERERLASLTLGARSGAAPDPEAMIEVAARAYRLSSEFVRPLLRWMS